MTFSQGYTIDSIFGVNGLMKLKSTDSNCYISPVYEIGDGNQILALHNTWYSSMLEHQGLIRFTSDGHKIDSSFNQNGIVEVDFGTVQSNTLTYNNGKFIKSLSSGNILIAGRRKIGNNYYVNTLASFFPNGTINTNFGNNGIFILPDSSTNSIVNFIYESKLFEANRLYVCTGTQPLYKDKIIALRLNGTIDSSYGVNGIASWHHLNNPNANYRYEVPLFDSNENAFILRSTNVLDTFAQAFIYEDVIIKISSLGFIDSTFGFNGVQQLDSNISFSGFNSFGPRAPVRTKDKFDNLYYIVKEKNASRKAVIKIKPNGQPDSTFGSNGLFVLEQIPSIPSFYKQHFQSIIALFDGSILLGGFLDNKDSLAHGYDFATLKLTTNGLPDTNFFNQGYFRHEIVTNYPDQIHQLIEHNKDIYLTGQADDPNAFVDNYFAVMKLKYNNSPNNINSIDISNATIYPNPTHGKIEIKGIQPEWIQIYSMDGILIQTYFKNNQIDLQNYSSGIYLLKIKTKDGEFHKKLLKQ